MTRLDFTMRAQRLREWCWAAVSVSADAFFIKHPTWTECKMAEEELGLDRCGARSSAIGYDRYCW